MLFYVDIHNLTSALKIKSYLIKLCKTVRLSENLVEVFGNVSGKYRKNRDLAMGKN